MKALRMTIAIVAVLGLVLGCGNPLTHVGPSGSAAASGRGTPYPVPPEPGTIGGPEAPLTVPLYAGRTIDVGTVEVWVEGEYLYVRCMTAPPWFLTETHLHVAADPAEFPQTSTGNPKPGQFDYPMIHGPGTSSHTECVPLAGLAQAEVLYLAAHAELERWGDGACVQAESAWAAGLEFPGANWATYFAGVLAAEQLDLTGYWDMYIIAEDEEGEPTELGPGVFYIHQEGSTLDCSQGFSGTLEGSLINLGIWFDTEEGPVFMGGQGTASEEQILIPFAEGPFGSGWIRLVPTTLSFGDFRMEGTCLYEEILLDTDHAYGETWVESFEEFEGEDRTFFGITYQDHRLQAQVWFSVSGSEMPAAPITLDGDSGLTLRWLIDDAGDIDELLCDSASLTLTACDENGMAGSFSAVFGGEVVSGDFDVPFVYGYGFEPPEEEDDGEGGEEEP